jgi:uncharacterized protein YegP (UPF0339 family)
MAARVPARAARIKENHIDQTTVGAESPIPVGWFVRCRPDHLDCRVIRLDACSRRRKRIRIKEKIMRFTITHDRDGYRARLWSGSNLVWWTEGYAHKVGAQNAIRIAKSSYNAPVYDKTTKAA